MMSRLLQEVNIQHYGFNPFPAFMADYGSFNQSMNEDMAEVGYTMLINLTFALFFWALFSYQRMYNDKLYAPKVDIEPESCPPKLSNRNMFSWMYELWSISDETILQKGGFDTLSFIRFYRVCVRIFVTYSVYAFVVLLPVNGTGNAIGSSEQKVDSFQRWSMTNIEQASSRTWFHLTGIFLLTAVTVYYLENEFVYYAKSRHRYLRQRHAHLRTVLVEGIPHKMRSQTTLALYFEVMYPNAVENVRLAQDLSELEDTVKERSYSLRTLETYLHEYHAAQLEVQQRRDAALLGNGNEQGSNYKHIMEASRPVINVNGECVDAIQHYVRQVQHLNSVVAKEQVKARSVAQRHDSLSEDESMRVIEGLLRVTEIGSLDKMLRLRSLRQRISFSGDGDEDGDTTDQELQQLGDEGGVSPMPIKKVTNRERGSLLEAGTHVGAYGGTDSTPGASKSDILNKSILVDTTLGDDAMDNLMYESFREEYADEDDTSGTFVNFRVHSHSSNRAVKSVESSSCFDYLCDVWQTDGLTAKWNRIVDVGRNNSMRPEDSFEEGEVLPLIRPLEERMKFLPKAFVTFKTFTAAAIAKQVIHMQLAGHMAISEAPEPRDVWWENMYLSRSSKTLRTFLVECFVVALIVFWVVPVTLLSHITEIGYLQKMTWIKFACDASPFLKSLLSLLQPAAIVGIMQLLPPLFCFLGEFQGCTSFSSNEFSSFDRYFLFQVINVFLVTTVAGSVGDALATVLTSPASGFQLLGNSLPKMGGYFTTFIFIKAFFGLGMEMIRLPAIFQSLGKTLFCRNFTLRERTEANWTDAHFGVLRFMDNPGSLRLATVYAQDALIMMLCVTFANIAPLLLISGIVYFGTASLVYTHQLLYVYKNEYETGGRWWPKIAQCIVIALIFGQCTMIGMMILKSAPSHIYLLLTALIAATVFYLYRMKFVYEPLGTHLPFDIATSMDLDNKLGFTSAANDKAAGKDYVNDNNAGTAAAGGEEDYLQPELLPAYTTVEEMTDFNITNHQDRVCGGSMKEDAV